MGLPGICSKFDDCFQKFRALVVGWGGSPNKGRHIHNIACCRRPQSTSNSTWYANSPFLTCCCSAVHARSHAHASMHTRAHAHEGGKLCARAHFAQTNLQPKAVRLPPVFFGLGLMSFPLVWEVRGGDLAERRRNSCLTEVVF